MATISNNVTTDIRLLEPDAIADMYEIKFPDENGNLIELRVTPHVSNILSGTTTPSGVNEVYYVSAEGNSYYPLRWGGAVYTPIPMAMRDAAVQGNGKMPRPRLALANVAGLVSNLLLRHRDLVGAQVARKRTFVKYLDVLDPTNGSTQTMGDPTAHFPVEVYYVERKVSENKFSVEFELACPADLQTTKLPARMMQASYCSATTYRGKGCGYCGVPKQGGPFMRMFDEPLTSRGVWATATTYAAGDWVVLEAPHWGFEKAFVCKQAHTSNNDNKPPFFDMWEEDICSREVAGCRLRFGNDIGGLRILAFPGMTRFQF